MWLEAVLSREDFLLLAAELLPICIRLGAPDSGHYVVLHEATDVELVGGRGLRISCDAQVRWPLLHVDLPIDVSDVTVLIEPSVPHAGGSLSFTPTIEHADVALLPSIIDTTVVHALNEALAKRREDLSWNFAATLTHEFSLPDLLSPLRGLGVEVLWGKVRTSPEAMVLVVSFRVAARRGDRPSMALPPAKGPALVRRPAARDGRLRPAFVALAMGLAVVAAYVGFRWGHRLAAHSA